MKTTHQIRIALLALSGFSFQFSALSQDTAFTYQGRLNDGVNPANGTYDLRFTIYDSSGGAGVVAGPMTNSPVAVNNGLFTVTLDFGAGVFTGADRWLDIGVRTNGGGGFSGLTPRQRLTPTPYAVTSGNLSGTLPASQLSGNVNAAALPAGGNWPLTSLLTVDSTTLAVDPVSDRIGIGTSAPSVALTVGTGIGYGIEHTDGTRRLSTFLDENGCWLGSVSPNKLLFFVNDGGSSMTLDLAGRLGLGTDTPAQKLHLFGLESRLRLESSGSESYAVTEYKTDVRTWHAGVGASGVWNALSGKYYLWDDTAAAVRLAVDPSGNVGLGTAAPEWPLHLVAAQGVARLDSTANTYGSVLELRNNTLLPEFLGAINFNNAFNTYPGQMACTGGGALTFRAGGFERMRIQPDGNVGIGTSSPTHALHVERPQATVLISSTDGTKGSQLVLSNSQPVSSVITGSILMQQNQSTNFIMIRGTDGGLCHLNLIIDSAYVAEFSKYYASFQKRVDMRNENDVALRVDRVFSDGALVTFSKNFDEKGNISVAGETISYNAFTGSHYAWTGAALQRGQLVRMTGRNRRFGDDPANEIVYGVTPTTSENDPACLGAYLALLEPAQPASSTNPHLVMAAGNGELWVVNSGGDIAPGDGLIASGAEGCAMKDDPARFAAGHVVARAGERVSWAEVQPNPDGVKRRLISVLFGPFVRGAVDPDGVALAAIQGLNQKLEETRAELNQKQTEFAEVKRELHALRQLVGSRAGKLSERQP